MKTASIFIFMVMLLLFSGAGIYREREIVVEALEQEIEVKMAVFDSLYQEGLRIGSKIDSIEVLMEAEKRDFLKSKIQKR